MYNTISLWESSDIQDAEYNVTEHATFRDALNHAIHHMFDDDGGSHEWFDECDQFPHFSYMYNDYGMTIARVR